MRSIGIFDAAAAAANNASLPHELRGLLAATCDDTIKQLGFPYGAHVCEVEIDPQTGALELVRYTAVDDVGRAINPMVVDGQTHGGGAQGIGQALWELCAYDAQGQLLSAAVERALDAAVCYLLAGVVGIPAIDSELAWFRAPADRGHVLPAVIFEFLGSVNWTINSAPSRNVNRLTPAIDAVGRRSDCRHWPSRI